MLTIPDPLHPAVVHFPIALILVGTGFLVVSLFISRFSLPWFAALLMLIGAGTAYLAEETGEDEARKIGLQPSPAGELLSEHAEWAERVPASALASGIIALVAAALATWINRPTSPTHTASKGKATVRVLTLAALLAALFSSYAVLQTGHYGGQMVYHHGVGSRESNIPSPVPSTSVQIEKSEQHESHH